MSGPGLVTLRVIFRRFAVAAELPAGAGAVVVNSAGHLLPNFSRKRHAVWLRLIGALHAGAMKVDAFRHMVRHYTAGFL